MNRLPLASEVEKQLSQLIAEEKYPPGSKIPVELELAEMFQVSRTTIRAAIKALCSRNVLEIRRGDGTYVTEKPGLSSDALGLDFMSISTLPQEIREASSIIQPAAAALGAVRYTPADVDYLKAAIQALEDGMEAYQKGEITYTELRRLDTSFHSSVIKTSHNRILDRLNDVFSSYTASLKEQEDLEIIKNSLKMHPIILEAMLSRDENKARDAMMDHLKSIQLSYH